MQASGPARECSVPHVRAPCRRNKFRDGGGTAGRERSLHKPAARSARGIARIVRLDGRRMPTQPKLNGNMVSQGNEIAADLGISEQRPDFGSRLMDRALRRRPSSAPSRWTERSRRRCEPAQNRPAREHRKLRPPVRAPVGTTRRSNPVSAMTIRSVIPATLAMQFLSVLRAVLHDHRQAKGWHQYFSTLRRSSQVREASQTSIGWIGHCSLTSH